MMRWMGQTNSSSVPGYNASQNPGTGPLDVIRNVYDLYGGSREWTLEAAFTGYRVSRGGVFKNENSPSISGHNYPASTASGYGSRLTLYIV